MSGQYRNIEVEIALLTSIPGFFLGGMLNYNKDIVGIVLSSVVTGVAVFFASYYAMVLVFSGKKKAEPEEDKFTEFKPGPGVAHSGPERSGPKKGKKVDVITRESNDDLFDDIYGKK
jgi:hypothetical protein